MSAGYCAACLATETLGYSYLNGALRPLLAVYQCRKHAATGLRNQ